MCELFLWSRNINKERIGQDYDSQSDPHNVNTYSMLNHWSDNELSSRAAEHSDALRGAYRGCEIPGRESARRKVNCTSERERGTSSLQQTADVPCQNRRRTEEQTADS